VITPSHNPPDSGGFKYNPPNGGPADTTSRAWIENLANQLLQKSGSPRSARGYAKARSAATTHPTTMSAPMSRSRQDHRLDVIRDSKVHMGVDPLGGAGVHYWARIAERYALDLDVVSDEVDPTFAS
jgi:phosphoglucomutase